MNNLIYNFDLNDTDVNSSTGVFSLVEYLRQSVETFPKSERPRYLADRGWNYETVNRSNRVYKAWTHPRLASKGVKVDDAIERQLYWELKQEKKVIPIRFN